MATDRLSAASSDPNPLGAYLKDRRGKLDPKSFGFSSTRRRTPGLRREEVAQRASVSATWYTWLEQGRGGAPSVDVLERLASALTLNATEREHLFLLAQGRPPEVRAEAIEVVTPRLQRVLDALTHSPAFVKNSTWDIIAWNRAATIVMTDYGLMPVEKRNMLWLMFTERARAMPSWPTVARGIVASFRADVARAGMPKRAESLVRELCLEHPEFDEMWRDHDVLSHGEGTKHIQHPVAGRIGLDYSTLAVVGQANLALVVYTPATPEDEAKIARLIDA